MANSTLLQCAWRILSKESESPAPNEDSVPTVQSSTQSPSPKASHLLNLPTEIFDDIINRLDLPSATCLSLCNKTFSTYSGLKSKYQDTQIGPTKDRAKFLAQLTREFANIGVCWDCAMLYDRSIFPNPGDPARPRSCLSYKALPGKDKRHLRCSNASQMVHIGLFSVYTITFEDIFLAMKGYRHGRTTLEELDHLEVGHDRLRGLTTVTSCHARVVSNELLHRRQIWIKTREDTRRPKNLSRLLELLASELCLHSRYPTADSDYKIIDELQHHLAITAEKSRKDDYHHQWEWRSRACCGQCHSEYMLEARHQEHGQEIFLGLTTWCNFGSGLSDDDEKWRSMDRGSTPSGIEVTKRIRDSFEAQQGEEVEALSIRNIQLLQSRDGRFWRNFCKNRCLQGAPLTPSTGYLESWYDRVVYGHPAIPHFFEYVYKRSIGRVWDKERLKEM